MLIGFHVAPPSSVRKAPVAEMGSEHPVLVGRVEDECVQAHATGAGLPIGSESCMRSEAVHLAPTLATVERAEQRRVLDACVDRVRVSCRRLEVPDPRELPRVRRPVVPLVRAGGAAVDELVADGMPTRSAVVRALDDLAGTSSTTVTRRCRFGSAGDPARWYISQPPKSGPLIAQSRRAPPEVAMNAPFWVPISSQPPLTERFSHLGRRPPGRHSSILA